jgi:predicted O-methyltransferase YrrM
MSEVGWFRRGELPSPLFLPLQNLIDGRSFPPPPPGQYQGDPAAKALLWPTLDDYANVPIPPPVPAIFADSASINFTLSCDLLTGSLLRTLAAAKPAGHFLELGTGTGVGAAWLLDGMDAHSQLTTIDINPDNQSIARRYLGHDPRIEFVLADADAFIASAPKHHFDLIFGDTFAAAYGNLAGTLDLVKPGGFLIKDDVLPVHGWGNDLPRLAPQMITALEARPDFKITKMCWSTGVIVAVRSC